MGGISRVIVRYANALSNDKKYKIEVISKEEPQRGNVVLEELNRSVKFSFIKPREIEEKRESLKDKKGLVNKILRERFRSSERLYMKRWLKKFFQNEENVAVVIDFDMSIWKYMSVIPVPVIRKI